eukprot:2469877-Amphidinium_carterae.1
MLDDTRPRIRTQVHTTVIVRAKGLVWATPDDVSRDITAVKSNTGPIQAPQHRQCTLHDRLSGRRRASAF